MKLIILLILLIQTTYVFSQPKDEMSNKADCTTGLDGVITLNRIKCTEELDARVLYARKSKAALKEEIDALTMQHELDNLKGVKKKSAKKPKVVSYRPNIKVLALYESGALVNVRGYEKSIKVSDRIAGAIVTHISSENLVISYKNRTYRYFVR